MRMRGYIESLHKLVEQQNEEREQVKQQQAVTLQATGPTQVKDLDQQIIEIIRSLPPARVQRPWTMDEWVRLLRGRYRRHPHSQHISASLRRLGWQRKRIYGAHWGGRRYWHPTME